MRCTGFLLCLATAAFFAAGCGNTNIEACTAYVEKANAEVDACGGNPIYSVEETCPETLANGGDCSTYYDCLAEGTMCDSTTGTVTVASAGCTSC